jgi:lysophospholipase L1-like esterase
MSASPEANRFRWATGTRIQKEEATQVFDLRSAVRTTGLAVQFVLVGLVGLPCLVGAAPGAETKIACVGDSITEHSGFTEQLAAKLGGGYAVKNFGVSGSTLLKNGDMPYWRQPAFNASTDSQPNIVVIMLGTNDTKPQNWKLKSEFLADYEALIAHYQGLASHPTVYAALPPRIYGSNSYAIVDSVLDKEMLVLIRRAAREKSAPIIDVYAACSGMSENFPDRVHPNGDGAKAIADAMFEALRPAGAPVSETGAVRSATQPRQ